MSRRTVLGAGVVPVGRRETATRLQRLSAEASGHRVAAACRRWLPVPAVALATLLGACGSGGGPTAPDASSVVAINIVGSNGNSAYTPNPAKVSAGSYVMLKNYTTETHHIVMDDGSVDFGEISAGTSSEREFRAGGGNYHCTIHRTMVGSINGQLPPEPRRCDPDFYDLSHCCDGFYC